MYLLGLNRKGDIFKDDDGVTGVPEFLTLIKKEKFGPTALKWVALVCDYDSPYRHFVERERVKSVSKKVFDKYEWKGIKNEKIAVAINKYKELQFDPLDAQLVAFNEKIDEYTRLMRDTRINEDNAESMQKIMIGIEKVLNTRERINNSMKSLTCRSYCWRL